MSENKTHLDIDYVANLARIELTNTEKDRFSGQLESILGYIDKLDELDTTAVEPMAHPHEVANVWGEDKVVDGLPVEEALRNAPERRGNQIVVPKIVE